MKRKYHFKEIDSTSSYLKRNYQKMPNYSMVSASFQYNGHGRNNRQWESNNNSNLMFSILIKDEALICKFASISLATGVIILEVLKELNLPNLSIKWPNDVYVNDKKICGILLESISYENKIEMLSVGIGLNVNQKDFKEENAISVYNILNKKKNLNILKNKIYKKIIKGFNLLKDDKFDYLKVVRKYNYLLNKEVYAIINNQKILVKVLDINDDNSLKVQYNNNYHNVFTDEISFHK